MILGPRAAVITTDAFQAALSFYRDELGLSLAREYKAGSSDRTDHGSPSWAEISGVGDGLGVILASRGVFGPDLFPGAGLLLESDSPGADAQKLVDQGYSRVCDVFTDAWWREVAIVRGVDNVTLVLAQFTGRLQHLHDQDHTT